MAAKSHGPILGNPGWTAAIFTVIVLVGFVGLVVSSGSGHHEGGAAHHEGGGEHAAPSGSASAPAPAERH